MNKPEKKTYYYEDGSVESEAWCLNGEYHREDGPAYICYKKDGSVAEEGWYLANKLHRKDGPAYIRYREDGSVKRETWYLNGNFHRKDGPAITYYRQDGSVRAESWYLNDKRLPKRDFKSPEQIKEMKAFRLFTPVELARMRCEVV